MDADPYCIGSLYVKVGGSNIRGPVLRSLEVDPGGTAPSPFPYEGLISAQGNFLKFKRP